MHLTTVKYLLNLEEQVNIKDKFIRLLTRIFISNRQAGVKPYYLPSLIKEM